MTERTDTLLPAILIDRARAVLDANRAAGRCIAVAESCTGGLVAAALTEIGEEALADRLIRHQARIGGATDYAALKKAVAGGAVPAGKEGIDGELEPQKGLASIAPACTLA